MLVTHTLGAISSTEMVRDFRKRSSPFPTWGHACKRYSNLFLVWLMLSCLPAHHKQAHLHIGVSPRGRRKMSWEQSHDFKKNCHKSSLGGKQAMSWWNVPQTDQAWDSEINWHLSLLFSNHFSQIWQRKGHIFSWCPLGTTSIHYFFLKQHNPSNKYNIWWHLVTSEIYDRW